MSILDVATTDGARPPDMIEPPGETIPAGALRVRVSGSLSAFPEWPRSGGAGKALCHVFQCADVIEVWLDTIGAARRVRTFFVGVHDETGQPVMLLPLGIERIRGIRVLGFLDGTVVDYSQPVLFPPAARVDAAAMARLWPQIIAALPGFDVAILDKMTAEVGGQANPLMHLDVVRMSESGHAMSLGGSSDDLERRLPAPKNHLRLMRKLSRETSVALEVAETPERAAEFLDHMIENKQRKFDETRVPGFEVPGKLAFYHEATRRLLVDGPLHLSAIRVGDTVIASHWGLINGDRFHFLMPAYSDGAWRKYAPGRMLNEGLIRWGHAAGFAWSDFGIGDEAYKQEYCDVVIPLHVAVIPVSLRGRLYVLSGAIIARLRASRLWQRLRPYKWTLLRAVKRGKPRAHSADVEAGSAQEPPTRREP